MVLILLADVFNTYFDAKCSYLIHFIHHIQWMYDLYIFKMQWYFFVDHIIYFHDCRICVSEKIHWPYVYCLSHRRSLGFLFSWSDYINLASIIYPLIFQNFKLYEGYKYTIIGNFSSYTNEKAAINVTFFIISSSVFCCMQHQPLTLNHF